MWQGVGNELAERIIVQITEVFVKEGIPADAIQVLIKENPKTHWGIGGMPCSEKFKNAEVPK